MAEVTLNLEGGELAAETNGQCPVEWLVCVIGFATACMAAAVVIYKAPNGIFDRHKCAYYASVISTGVVGLAEVFAAVIWMSDASGGHHPHSLARRCVLCASFLPLAFMAGLGGVRILVK